MLSFLGINDGFSNTCRSSRPADKGLSVWKPPDFCPPAFFIKNLATFYAGEADFVRFDERFFFSFSYFKHPSNSFINCFHSQVAFNLHSCRKIHAADFSSKDTSFNLKLGYVYGGPYNWLKAAVPNVCAAAPWCVV